MARSRVKVHAPRRWPMRACITLACQSLHVYDVKWGIAIARITWTPGSCVTREPWHAYYAYYPARTIDRRNVVNAPGTFPSNWPPVIAVATSTHHLRSILRIIQLQRVMHLRATPTQGLTKRTMRDTFLAEPRRAKNKTIIATKYAVAAKTFIRLYAEIRSSVRYAEVFRNAFNKICFSCHRGTYG